MCGIAGVIYADGSRPVDPGVLRAMGSVPAIFVGLLAGVWVDRVSRQRLLIVADIIAAACSKPPTAFFAIGLAASYTSSTDSSLDLKFPNCPENPFKTTTATGNFPS